jgi:hypothetical protein
MQTDSGANRTFIQFLAEFRTDFGGWSHNRLILQPQTAAMQWKGE